MANRDLTDLDLKTFRRLQKKRYNIPRRKSSSSVAKAWRLATLAGGCVAAAIPVVIAATYLAQDNPAAQSHVTWQPALATQDAGQTTSTTESGERPTADATTLDTKAEDVTSKPELSSKHSPTGISPLLQSIPASVVAKASASVTTNSLTTNRDSQTPNSQTPNSIKQATAAVPSSFPPSSSETEAKEQKHKWDSERVEVRAGDSLARIISRAGFSPRVVHEIMSAGEGTDHLRHLHPGEKITLLRDKDGRLAGLQYNVDARTTLTVERQGSDSASAGSTLQASLQSREIIRHRIQAEQPLQGSLYLTARRAGLSEQMTMNLAGILSWEIDLGRHLRKNDRLVVIYDKLKSPSGELLDTEIQAVRYEGSVAELEAIRFEQEDGSASFYNIEGENLRRELQRYPVEYTRISSHFDLNRRHPILGVRRPHLGVDLAAPTGTPIYAAGDGRVVERGRNGGYGRLVSIKHGSGYRTLYAHLNSYARGLGVGDRVEHGQLIGYVGDSGIATGPHLHYEVIVNGRHRDPVKVDLPQAEPLPSHYQADFLNHAKPLLQALREPTGKDEEVRLAARD